jgi:ribonuclease BN (tRNA processing enzyme)
MDPAHEPGCDRRHTSRQRCNVNVIPRPSSERAEPSAPAPQGETGERPVQSNAVTIEFLGSGDAFGSGGRFQACLLLRSPSGLLLLDCGASSLVAMKHAGVDPGEIDAVLISHLHGDHFGGLPFLILDGQFARRERPLIIAGPPGLRTRVGAAMEVFFPGSSEVERRFAVEYLQLPDRVRAKVGGVSVTPFEVDHASGAPAFALRVECDGRVVAYSGDTAWTEGLLAAAQDADLFVCEAYFGEKRVRYHLDYATLKEHAPRLRCKRIILTHMSPDMLRRPDCDFERAEDGLIVQL